MYPDKDTQTLVVWNPCAYDAPTPRTPRCRITANGRELESEALVVKIERDNNAVARSRVLSHALSLGEARIDCTAVRAEMGEPIIEEAVAVWADWDHALDAWYRQIPTVVTLWCEGTRTSGKPWRGADHADSVEPGEQMRQLTLNIGLAGQRTSEYYEISLPVEAAIIGAQGHERIVVTRRHGWDTTALAHWTRGALGVEWPKAVNLAVEALNGPRDAAAMRIAMNSDAMLSDEAPGRTANIMWNGTGPAIVYSNDRIVTAIREGH